MWIALCFIPAAASGLDFGSSDSMGGVITSLGDGGARGHVGSSAVQTDIWGWQWKT